MKKDLYVSIKKLSAVETPALSTATKDEFVPGAWNTKSPPVDYTVEATLLSDIEVGKPAAMLREKRNGVEVPGIWVTSNVLEIDQNKFYTENSVYLVTQE